MARAVMPEQHCAGVLGGYRELKRVKDEEGSRFSGGLVMHARYLLLQLIGKGGFSEVFQVWLRSHLWPCTMRRHNKPSCMLTPAPNDGQAAHGQPMD